jgi:hypothetical protein
VRREVRRERPGEGGHSSGASSSNLSITWLAVTVYVQRWLEIGLHALERVGKGKAG